MMDPGLDSPGLCLDSSSLLATTRTPDFLDLCLLCLACPAGLVQLMSALSHLDETFPTVFTYTELPFVCLPQ